MNRDGAALKTGQCLIRARTSPARTEPTRLRTRPGSVWSTRHQSKTTKRHAARVAQTARAAKMQQPERTHMRSPLTAPMASRDVAAWPSRRRKESRAPCSATARGPWARAATGCHRSGGARAGKAMARHGGHACPVCWSRRAPARANAPATNVGSLGGPSATRALRARSEPTAESRQRLGASQAIWRVRAALRLSRQRA